MASVCSFLLCLLFYWVTAAVAAKADLGPGLLSLPIELPVRVVRGGSSLPGGRWEQDERPWGPYRDSRRRASRWTSQSGKRSPPSSVPHRSPPRSIAKEWRDDCRNHAGKGEPMTKALVMSCLAIYLLEHVVRVKGLGEMIRFNHQSPAWHQPLTACFSHSEKPEHVMSNGICERELGSLGLLMVFAVCGTLSNIIGLAVLPRNTISLGASGAVFGLYTVAVISKLFSASYNGGNGASIFKRSSKLMEAIVLGWFVLHSVIREIGMSIIGGKENMGIVTGINYIAHLGGVAAGGSLMSLLRRGGTFPKRRRGAFNNIEHDRR